MADDPTVLLLHGEEGHLVREEARRFIQRWSQGLVSEFGLEAMDPSGVSADRLRDTVMQAAFLDPHRLVVVRGLTPNKAETLAPALPHVADSTRLLLTVNGRLAAGGKLVRAVRSVPGGQVVEMARLKPRQIADWARRRAESLGLSPAAADLVVKVSVQDLGVIESELAKLAAYRDSGHPVNPKVARELLVGGRVDEVYRITDHLLPTPGPEAHRLIDDLLRTGVPATSLAYRIARHLSLVLQVKSRQGRGERLNEIQARVREHPFVVQKAFEAAQACTTAQLERGLEVLLEYEWEVKSGQIDAELGLKTLVARL